MLKRYLNFEEMNIIGAGGYGIVLSSQNNKNLKEAFKLFKDIQACESLKQEAIIQNHVYYLFKKYLPEVKIPSITYVTMNNIYYKNIPYLCGIGMEYLEPPSGFNEQVHMLLGYTGDDIDTEWGMKMAEEVSEKNPTRGFFASPETLEFIWNYENNAMTLEKLAFLMGKSLRLMLDFGILPIDLEWVWSNGHPNIIDFGLCEYGYIDPYIFLEKKGLKGLADDFYIPKKYDKGYKEFMEGFSISLT